LAHFEAGDTERAAVAKLEALLPKKARSRA
jgi:hypothetical protein